MHEICALVAIIHPVALVNILVADTTEPWEIAMNVRNRVDESERVMMISWSWNSGGGKRTALVDPKLTGCANIRRIFSFLMTGITLKKGFLLYQCQRVLLMSLMMKHSLFESTKHTHTSNSHSTHA